MHPNIPKNIEAKLRNNPMNYKRIKSLLISGAVFFLITSCSQDKDNNPATGNGSFRLSLETNSEVIPVMRSGANDEASAPSAEDFAITLTREDGSVVKTWSTINNIPYDATYDVGNYTISATYGSLENEGFDVPYYSGEAQFTIRDKETTPVDVVCTLGHVKVSINYTETFTKYFSEYRTTIRSVGGDDIIFKKDETRSAYVRPGDISLKLDLVKTNGVSASYEPARITNATARQHYIITFDVSESVGGAVLTITFDDTTAVEPITLDISDEAMVAPAPYINMTGVNDGGVVEIQECEYPENELAASIMARGGLVGCTMFVESEYLASLGIPTELELTELTTEQAQLFQSLGLELRGFDSNRQTMGLIDFSNFTPSLQIANGSADHKFTFTARDVNGKVSDPMTFTIHNTPLTFEMGDIEDVMLGSTSIDIPFTCNGKNIDNVKLFRIRNGVPEEINYTIVNHDGENYTIRTQLDVANEAQTLQLAYTTRYAPSQLVNIIVPSYTIQCNDYDVWTSHATTSLIVDETSLQDVVKEYITFYLYEDDSWTVIKPQSIDGGYKFADLVPGKSYTIATSCLADQSDLDIQKAFTFTTEETTPIPNGNLESWTQWFSQSINKGGRYGKLAGWVQETIVLSSSNPDGWATANTKTVPTSPSTANSWYMVPSTLPTSGVSGNAALIRNVAWDNNGSTPPQGLWGVIQSLNSLNVPTISQRSAGKMFLGSYSYDHNLGTELYNEGIAFTSRPQKLTGYYKYIAVGGDTHGVVTVTVENRTDINKVTTLATKTVKLTPAATYSYFEVELPYNNTQCKATHLRVSFTSSNNASNYQLTEKNNITTKDDKAQAISTGSELYIDNISLTY